MIPDNHIILRPFPSLLPSLRGRKPYTVGAVAFEKKRFKVRMRMEQQRRRFMATREAKATEEEEEGTHKVDLSGMSLNSLSNPALNLTGITKLDLSNNNLESIPESLTARLLNVVVLDVHSNQLKSLPNSMGCLSKLRVLNVSGNLLESLPKTIEDCRALEDLNANFNKLAKLPDTIGFELTNLQKLSVNSNKLAFLPCSTSHMVALRSLDAHLNCLRSLPDGLENLSRLEVLNVSQNFQYLSSLPYSLGLLSNLVELDVSYNTITALPESLAMLPKLRTLHAQGNPLVSPSLDVVDQGIDAVRRYLAARINGTIGDPQASPRKASSWLGRVVKCGTFNGRTTGSSAGVGNKEGFLLSGYTSMDGLASPRHMGMLSPRRLFSPKSFSPRR